MARRIAFSAVVVMFVALLLPAAARAADRRVQVEPVAMRGVIAALLNKPKKAKIQRTDGSKLSGTLIAATESGLLFEAKKGAAPIIPYDQLSTIRLDLGPHRGWEALGFAAGFVGGIAGGIRLGFGGYGQAAELAGVTLMIGGPIIGAELLGHFHRKWLIIEVH